MPRKYVLSVDDINRRRGQSWEYHYNNRQLAKMYDPTDAARVSQIIMREAPPPEMRIDGSLLDGMANLRGMSAALAKTFQRGMPREMMCVWYWSESAWMEYVRQFQNLPEVTESYVYVYDAILDAARLVPASTVARRGRPIRVSIPSRARVK